MKLIKLLQNGLDAIASAYAEPRKYEVPTNGFARDNEKLRGDVNNVGDDLRRAIDKHGESYKYSRHR